MNKLSVRLGGYRRFDFLAAMPVSDGRLHFVPVPDLNDVNDLGLRCAIDASHLRNLQRAAKEHADFEEVPLRAYEEVTRLAREHHRFVRGVDPLLSERDGSLAQPLQAVLEISREILGEGRFRSWSSSRAPPSSTTACSGSTVDLP